jgi:hypothetical protein
MVVETIVVTIVVTCVESSAAGTMRRARRALLAGAECCAASIFELGDKLAACEVPMPVVTGEEDWPCLGPVLIILAEVREQ